MNVLKRFFLFVLLVIGFSGYSQSFFRTKQIVADSSVICFDTLSVIPNSVLVMHKNQPLSSSQFAIDYFKASIQLLDSALLHDTITIQYQVFNVNLTQPYMHKNKRLIEQRQLISINEFSSGDKKTDNPWLENSSDLNKTGSITRGISIGNRQDVVVNSDLNLQLDGIIFDDFMIKAVISDKNIPLQPEGNTQQLQEFDKVFIQLYNKSVKITAGDFDIAAPSSALLKANKKVLGAMVDYRYQFADSSSFSTASAFAVTKGKFTRINLVSIDGNQGPYRLTPENGDANIVVIGGSERVFVDGALLKRGLDNDYSIDYNLGEIIFTAKRIVSVESKIVVEFEYTDRHYSRSLFATFNQWKSKKMTVDFNVYSEQDMKNQSIQPELTTEQKLILHNAGNQTSQMISPAFDSVVFNSNQVLYKLMDTTITAIHYDSVFVYSANSDSAFYALSFTNVGANGGDYMLLNNTINGRVFAWVAPENGRHQGSYSPIYILVPPQKKQMVTGKISYQISANSVVNVELAFSNFDENSFSPYGKGDDYGGSIITSYQNRFFFHRKDTLPKPQIITKVSHQFMSATFSEIEPAKNSEFYRRFNIQNAGLLKADMNLLSADVLFKGVKSGLANYAFNYLNFKSLYEGYQHMVNFSWNPKYVNIETQGFNTSGRGSDSKSDYFKLDQLVRLKSRIGNVGVKYEIENNQMKYNATDSLATTSVELSKYEVFVENPDSIKVKYRLWHNVKNLSLPIQNRMTAYSITSEDGASLKFNQKSHTLNLSSIYREVRYSSRDTADNDYAFIGNLTYQGTFLKGAIVANTYYQTSTGREQRKEYQYLKVAKGQGQYIWTDFNNNNVEDLDEFSIAPFVDQAEYIRLWVLTNDYVKTIMNEFNQTLLLNPSSILTSKTTLAKLGSMLKNQTSVFISNKTTDGPEIGANPFSFASSDENIVASSRSMRNNFSVNQSNPVWNAEYVYNNQYNKLFLTSGFETKALISNAIILRSSVLKKLSIKSEFGRMDKKSGSELLLNRNYSIASQYIENTISYLRSSNFRTSLSYKYMEKTSALNSEQSTSFFNQANIELQYNLPKKGVLMSKLSFIDIRFNQSVNSPLAIELLEGLSNGKNVIYTMSFQTVISKNIQLNTSYEFRLSADNSVVQVGNISIRAFF